MPELPEVETVRRQLEPELTGAQIESVQIHDPTWVEGLDPSRFEQALTGAGIMGLARSGKYLRLLLAGRREVLMHLRMTGNLILVGPSGQIGDPRLEEPDGDRKHLRASISIDGERELWFIDPRRFGRALVLDAAEAEEYLRSRLGPEPFSPAFTPLVLADSAGRRRAPLKSFLLDQKVVAGVGNIYADEALFRARLHPLSPASAMRTEHYEALHAGVIEALEAGILNGGASIDDYRDARGAMGGMQDKFLVHRRAGEDCPSCGGEVSRIVVGGRSTYFCRTCQKRLRHRPRRASSSRSRGR